MIQGEDAGLKRQIIGRLRNFLRDPRTLFYLISAAGILLYFFLSLRYGGQLYTWMIQENAPEIRFIDYFSHLEDAVDRTDIYRHIAVASDAGTVYRPLFPPLAYCFYHLLYRLTAVQGSPSAVPGKAEAIPGALSVFTVYLIFNAVIFFCAIGMAGKRNRKKDLMIFVLLMLSAVFAGSGYLTGNSAMLVLGLLLAGLQLKDSPGAFRREIGLLLLAVCVALKIYPAVFGLLFLKEKRYKDLIRLILYSLILLFIPFVFFGGMEALRTWLDNITHPLLSSDYGRPQYLRGVFCTLIRQWTGREEPALAAVLTVMVCVLWVWLAWRSGSKQRTLFFLICIMVFFPSNSFRYTLSYFSIPLILLLKEEPGKKIPAWPVAIISTLYGLLYTVPIWWLAVVPMSRQYATYSVTSVEIYLYLVAYLLTVFTMIAELTARKPARE